MVGHWTETPLGAFADAMVETAPATGCCSRPRAEVADFIEATYDFDETRIEPIAGHVAGLVWCVQSPSLSLDAPRRAAYGAGAPRCGRCRRGSPRARLVHASPTRSRGSCCAGSAPAGSPAGRREWYGATDIRAVTSLGGHLRRRSTSAALAPVDPPCRFGFSSTPRRPSVTTVVTTVDLEST